jgi:hypothetical protein
LVPAPDWPERKKRLVFSRTAGGSGATLSPLAGDPPHLAVEVVEKVGVVHEHDVGLVHATSRVGEVVEHAVE